MVTWPSAMSTTLLSLRTHNTVVPRNSALPWRFERFEGKLQEHSGNLQKASVELAKEWRKDRALRHLEALLIVADSKSTFLLSGNGDVIEPDDGLCAIGSGGTYALAAARALLKHSKLSTKELAMEAMRIASEICIYTNANFTVEEL